MWHFKGQLVLSNDNSAPGASPALSTLFHSAAVRLQVVRERWVRHHGDIRGYEARVKVLKNRLGPAGHVVNLTIEFNGTVRGDLMNGLVSVPKLCAAQVDSLGCIHYS